MNRYNLVGGNDSSQNFGDVYAEARPGPFVGLLWCEGLITVKINRPKIAGIT